MRCVSFHFASFQLSSGGLRDPHRNPSPRFQSLTHTHTHLAASCAFSGEAPLTVGRSTWHTLSSSRTHARKRARARTHTHTHTQNHYHPPRHAGLEYLALGSAWFGHVPLLASPRAFDTCDPSYGSTSTCWVRWERTSTLTNRSLARQSRRVRTALRMHIQAQFQTNRFSSCTHNACVVPGGCVVTILVPRVGFRPHFLRIFNCCSFNIRLRQSRC